MSNNDFFTSEAFKELIAGIERKFGPIDYFTVCNHPEVPDHDIREEGEEGEELVVDEYPELPESAKMVMCSYCQERKPEADCQYVGDRTGPDLFEVPEYVCDDCWEGLGDL